MNSPQKAEALDVMLGHLRKTGGSSHLVEEDSTRPSSHKRLHETVTVGLRRYKVRTLKPDGIPGNPLRGKDLADLRITYVTMPESNSVAIVGIFDDRDRYR